MADYNSSLPVRTQTNGDVVAQLVDGTVVSQKLAINASGQALVLDGSDGSVTGGAAAGFSSLAGGQYNTSLPTLTATDQASLQLDSSGRLIIAPLTSGSSVTALQGTSPWITKDQADGSVSGGTAGSFSLLGGGIYNSTPLVLTTGQQASLQLDSAGALVVSAMVTFPYDENYGTVGATTLRTASQIGNATGAADFDAGSTGAQTQRVVANQGAANATPWNENIAEIAGSVPSATNALPTQIATAGAFVSASNPLPVIIDPAGSGTTVNDYKAASSIAAGSTDNHQYTAGGAIGFRLQQVIVSAEVRLKAVVSIETAVASGIFTPIFAGFNSSASPMIVIPLPSPSLVLVGVRVQVAVTNLDLAASDLYSTISGFTI